MTKHDKPADHAEHTGHAHNDAKAKDASHTMVINMITQRATAVQRHLFRPYSKHLTSLRAQS